MPMKKVNAMSLGVLVRLLAEDEPRTISELADETGLHYHTVRKWLRELHAQKVVYITGFERDSRDRDNAPLWKLGIDKTDKRKRKLTPAQRQQRVRDRKKLNQIGTLLCSSTKTVTTTLTNRSMTT